MPKKQMHLNLFFKLTGHYEEAWRHPRSRPERFWDISYFEEIAHLAERGKLDSLFFADTPGLDEVIGNNIGHLEPTVLLAALATATEHIGLIATASTTYNEPYNIARRFASIDHLSKGRAGWNIVTTWSSGAAANFGLDGIPQHTDRYTRGREFVEVCEQLWDSWDDDAIVIDREAGKYVDPSKVHRIDHQGQDFRVRGPHNMPRSPQGYPVLVQAGSSEEGRDFAATYAEAIFTAQLELGEAQAFAEDVRSRAKQKGRDPEKILILPGFSPIIGSTEAEAKLLEQEFTELTHIDNALGSLSKRLDGFDLSGYPLDGPLPDELLNRKNQTEGARSRAELILNLGRNENLTIRQIIQRMVARGHKVCTGTPEQVADEMERWFRSGAADGFNLMPAYMPGGLEDFVDQVVPELQRRGLFRTEYEGTTLRENYGLDRPKNQLAAAREFAV